MVTEQELKEFELAKLKKQAEGKDENDPLAQIEELALDNKQLTAKFEEEKKKLLFKIAQQEKENRLERSAKEKADRAKEIAEWKYLNQQKTEIDGLSNLVKKEEISPEKRARQIFVERLKARMEKSQKLAEEKKDNTYYI